MGGQVSQRKTGSWTIAAVRNSVGEQLYHSSRFSWHVSDLFSEEDRDFFSSARYDAYFASHWEDGSKSVDLKL